MKHPGLASIAAVFLMCVGGTALDSSCSKHEPALIPREVLFGNPTKAGPTISPDAKRLAYLAPYNGVLNVWVKSRDGSDDHAVTSDADRGIRKYFWALDSKHIMYLKDASGIDNWRLYGVDLDTGETRDFTPFDSIQVSIVAYSKRFPHELVIQMNRENRELPDAYRLDIETGALTMVAKNPGGVGKWIADGDFLVRAAMAGRPQGGYDLIVREREDAPWRLLRSWDYEESASSSALRFTLDGKAIYCLDARDYNTGRLVKIAVADSSVEVIAEDPQYEVFSLFFHVDTYEMQAVAFARERIQWMILDESIRPDFDAVARLDEGDFGFESTDEADSTWVIGFTKDNGPYSYYLYERKTKQGKFLFTYMSELEKYTLARMESITIPARDGLVLHGYITYPPGKNKRNLPLVLRVHGGPFIRDYWGYNPEAQWLANRGYVCLQVDFRGSRGYGKDFANAGNKEWGGAMQNDLIDAVQWAVSRGIANPDKIAIAGSSYGGYATLAALTTTDKLFRCGIDVSGQSNLNGWLTSLPPSWGPSKSTLFKRVGNPATEAEFLVSRSPLFKADRITSPLLIVQGGNDPYVPRADAERIVAALKANGVPCEYLFFPDEGHGIGKIQNRLRFYETAEVFLAKYLGGRCEETAAP